MTAVERNASIYQVNPVGRIPREGKAEFVRRGGLGSTRRYPGGGRAGQINL